MSNKILIVLIGVMLIIMLGLGGGLFMMWSKISALDAKSSQPAKADAKPPEVEHNLGPIYSLDTFIVNLADKGGNRYLRVTMDLELNSKVVEDEIKERLPQIRDAILMILPTRRFDDINNSSGKAALRDEIKKKINSFLVKGQISNVYFSEFVVQ